MTAIWSDQHVEKLKALWGAGDSASIIAEKLGNGATRSAVLGKIHRMEVSDGVRRPTQREFGKIEHADTHNARRQPTRRKEVEQSTKSPPARREPSAPRLPAVSRSSPRTALRPLLVLQEPVPTGKVTIMDLSDKTCKWPIGEPGDEGFHFCGVAKPSDVGTPYCPYHAQRAVQPVQPKRFSPSAFQNVGRKVVANVG